MNAVRRVAWVAHRNARVCVTLAVAALGAALIPMLARGGMRGVASGGAVGTIVAASVIALFGATLAHATWMTIDARSRTREEAGGELAFGALLLVATYLLIAATGGAHSYLHPLVYALVSFLLIVCEHRAIALAWIAGAIALEVLCGVSTPRVGASAVAYHVTLIGFFSIGNVLVLGSLTRRLRGEHGRKLSAELTRMRQEAHDFRLIGSRLPIGSRIARTREDEELHMAQGAVHAIHEQLYFNLDVLSAALGLHTCALLWVDDSLGPSASSSGRAAPKLIIKELATASEMVRDTPIIEGPGVLAAVVRDPKPLRLCALAGKRTPPYYAGPERVTDLCAVPLMEGQSLRAILCADRITDRPFSEAEERVLAKASEHVLRIVAQERAYVQIERAKYEQEQFYRASELLNQALTFSEVCQKTSAAISAIAPSSLIAITGYDTRARQHRVLSVELDPAVEQDRAWSDLREALMDRYFDDNGGLISAALKTRHHMPAHGELGDPEAVVFDAETCVRKAKSLLVLPLVRGESVLGTLVLASHKAGAFPAQVREMLRVIGHQVGVSLQNASMYRAMEEKATTDGLTGLTNHRSFQERYEQLHSLCERTGQRYSIILTDIDHFKSVNDTYGHPVGDAVLRRVAAILAARARKVDIVARYGGEEFVLVLPDTDGVGAAHFANKLREEIGAQTMNSENGSFRVTMSMGIAEFPLDGSERASLVARADEALYYCKEHGRNRVTRVAEMP